MKAHYNTRQKQPNHDEMETDYYTKQKQSKIDEKRYRKRRRSKGKDLKSEQTFLKEQFVDPFDWSQMINSFGMIDERSEESKVNMMEHNKNDCNMHDHNYYEKSYHLKDEFDKENYYNDKKLKNIVVQIIKKPVKFANWNMLDWTKKIF